MRDLRTPEKKRLERHLAKTAEDMLTTTIAGQAIGPAEPLTIENMAQRILDAIAPNDHWRVRPDGLLPIQSPVVRMTNSAGIRELHIGATAAMLMATKRYCPFEIIDLDAGMRRFGGAGDVGS